MKPLRFLQIGLGGYAAVHTRSIQELVKEGLAEFIAAADPFVEQNAERIAELKGQGVRHYADYNEMLREESADAVAIGTPIPFHTEMMLAAIGRGLNVLVEKPPVVLIQDLDRIQAEATKRKLLVQTGFQNIVDEPAQEVKAALLEGKFGRIRRLTVQGLWQRVDSYYQRASWAGKVRLGERWALDGPVNNPLIHYMHQALFFAGPEQNATARPLRVQAELYKAHDIEGEDTMCARARLETGAEMMVYLTLCAPTSTPAQARIDCEKATIHWQQGIVKILTEGHEAAIERPGQQIALVNFRNFLRAVRGEEPSRNPLSASRNIVLHNNGCYLSSGAIHRIPAEYLKRYPAHDSIATDVEDIRELIEDAAEDHKLFSEMKVPWARASEVVELDFVEFDPGFLVQ